MLQPSDSDKKLESAIIGLGSNLAYEQTSPREILQEALEMLGEKSINISAVSQFYATDCYPVGAGPDYVNAAALLTTTLSAADLLAELHKVEQTMGRERVQRWGQRTLDLDLLAYNSEIAPDLATYSHWRCLPPEQQETMAPQQMILPHPRLQDRAFVLVPMADLVPHWLHPVIKRTTRQMLADLGVGELAKVRLL